MMLRFLCALCFLPALSAFAADESSFPAPYDSVYRIQATGHGRVADGSAVLIAPSRLLTSCHVTRHAKTIRVGREHLLWRAQLTKADIARDLCIL